MDDSNWGNFVGEEARKNYSEWQRNGFYDKYLSGTNVLDIGYAGYLDNVRPITPHAIGIGLDYPGYDGRTLPFDDGSQDAVFASHCLEHIEDYRGSLADWFRVLKVGGFLIVAVPHQYLYERNLRLPSRFNLDHRRLYTPASLLREIEEALNPLSYRVRLLEDNDRGFDYSIEPKEHATGCYEILLVVEKIAEPFWAADMMDEPVIRNLPPGAFVPLPRPADHSPVYAISSTGTPQSVIAFKMDHLGDFILATPALKALRDAFPEARLTLVCGEWNEARARELGVFDEIIGFSIFARNASLNGLYPFDAKMEELKKLLGQRRFDLAIDLRVDEDTRAVLKYVNADVRAGLGYPRDFKFLDIALPMQSSTTAGRAGIYNVDASFFTAKYGANHGFAIDLPAGSYPAGTTLIWGPYRSLTAGNYLIRVLMEDDAGETPPLDYDIVCDGGNRRIASGHCDAIASSGVWVELREPIKDLEVRIWGRDQASRPVSFRGCQIRKEGSMDGAHQSEAMAMLVALVGQRMRFRPTEGQVA